MEARAPEAAGWSIHSRLSQRSCNGPNGSQHEPGWNFTAFPGTFTHTRIAGSPQFEFHTDHIESKVLKLLWFSFFPREGMWTHIEGNGLDNGPFNRNRAGYRTVFSYLFWRLLQGGKKIVLWTFFKFFFFFWAFLFPKKLPNFHRQPSWATVERRENAIFCSRRLSPWFHRVSVEAAKEKWFRRREAAT